MRTAVRTRKLVKFLAAGAPAFGVALAINWVLAQRLGWPTPLAYAIVLVVQVSVNFWMCKWFVFEHSAVGSLWRQFSTFFTGIALFRVADWAVYSLITHYTPTPPIVMQAINVVLFSVLKFIFSERTFEQSPPPRASL